MSRILIFTSLFCFLCSCTNSRVMNSTSKKTTASPQPEVTSPKKVPQQAIVPEPIITGEEPRFQLTQLKFTPNKFFTMRDKIVFTGLDKKFDQKKLKNIQLTIKSHCLTGENSKDSVLIHTVQRSLSPSIPLLELLPPELLFMNRGTQLVPSCSFSFTAKDISSQDIHHFEVPHLPIHDMDSQEYIYLITSTAKDSGSAITHKYPYVFLNTPLQIDIAEYVNRTDRPYPKINHLQLKCEDYTIDRTLFQDDSLITFSTFFRHSFADIKTVQEKPVQKCRIFGYYNSHNKKTIVAVSLLFYVVHKKWLLSPSVFLKPKFELSLYREFNRKTADNLYPKMYGNKPPVTPIAWYDYIIDNPHPHPVSIAIDNYNEASIDTVMHVPYFQNGQAFYRDHDFSMKFGNIVRRAGQYYTQTQDKTLFITLSPKSKISIPILLKHGIPFCQNAYALGFVVKNPIIPIKQLVSNQSQFATHKDNVLTVVKNNIIINQNKKHYPWFGPDRMNVNKMDTEYNVLFMDRFFPIYRGPSSGVFATYQFEFNRFNCNYRRRVLFPGVSYENFVLFVSFNSIGSDLNTFADKQYKNIHSGYFQHIDDFIRLVHRNGF